MPTPRVSEVSHAVLRIGAGLLFLQHGLSKVFGLLGGTAQPLASLFGIAGLVELIGGLLIVVGFLTRPVAAVLMLQMCVAYATHAAQGGAWAIPNGGEEGPAHLIYS